MQKSVQQLGRSAAEAPGLFQARVCGEDRVEWLNASDLQQQKENQIPYLEEVFSQENASEQKNRNGVTTWNWMPSEVRSGSAQADRRSAMLKAR